MGYNLYLGYHPDGNGSFIFGPSLDLLTIMDDSERDAVGTQRALEFIRAQPERVLPLALNRLGFFFGLEKRVLMYFYSNNILGYIPLPGLLLTAAILLLPLVFVSIFAVLGGVVLRHTPQLDVFTLLLVAYVAPHVLILAEDRFHLALIPVMAIWAAYAFTLIKEREYKENTNGRVLLIASVLIFFFLLNWGLELNRDADKISAIFGPNGNQSHFSY
ncbi:MAG: hypothetical protein IPJ47_20875 [Anaerolineales bacterium]|nr:hypothetical protein [Anaerolineales bacterium]